MQRPTPHQRDPCDALADVRCHTERERNVRERAERHQPDAIALVLAYQLDDCLNGVRLLCRARDRRKLRPAESGFAMNVWRVARRCDQWSLGAGEDGGTDPKDIA